MDELAIRTQRRPDRSSQPPLDRGILQAEAEREHALMLAAADDRHLPIHRLSPPRQQLRDAEMATLSDELGEAAFAAAWEEGRAMSADQAVRYALEETDVSPGRSPA
jgi:hypothetical protein